MGIKGESLGQKLHFLRVLIERNPQALYILRNLEKFKNLIKIPFFIRKIAADFNNFQASRTSAQKLLVT